ncbi:MAG TPA: ATP-binding SpoIIE family protein phosphatase [Pedococcus sp.]|nr:ATP-binding SpoIIE family protein phosphatase [Pedococcus sp.]
MTAAELARACDWSATALGPRSQWPAAVEHVVTTLLEAPVPVCYQHGPSLAMVYNDAFATLLGARHPDAFGQPTRVVVQDVWDQPNVGAAFVQVFETGVPFVEHGVRLALRRGRPTTSQPDFGYYTRAGSPVRDDTGAVVGVLHVVLETTEGVERIQEVASLARSLAVAATVDDVCKVALHHAALTLPAVEVQICLPEGISSPGALAEGGGAAGTAGFRATRFSPAEAASPLEERLPLIWTPLTGEDRLVVLRTLSGERPAQDDGVVVLRMPINGHSGAVILRVPNAQLPADAHTMLTSAAALVGQAIARAQLFDRERTTAELLQRALLPQALPQSRSFSLAGRYEPVSSGAVAGGDFYDAFPIADGRLVLVIGDVVGRGVAAATVMGQIRAATRGAAISDPEPESVLSSLDELVAGLDALWPASVNPGAGDHGVIGRGFGGELFVTMLYGLLDTHSGELTLASAGHCPPAVLPELRGATGERGRGHGGDDQADPAGPTGPSGPGGPGQRRQRPRIVDLVTGPPLGLGGVRPVQTLKLAVGEVLLAFTDGLLERRASSLAEGEMRLLEVLDNLTADSPRTVCQQVIESMVDPGGFEDDCALLAVGRSSVEHRSAALVVPPVPEAVRPARDWARAQMNDWGIGEGEQFAVVTGLSELVTNTVLHAGTDAHVSLELDGTRLTLTVSDTGTRGEPTTPAQGGAATRGRGLKLVRSISDAFGTHRSATGSTVWFEVEVTPPDPGHPPT